LENEKPVANQMPGFVGAGSWDLSFRVEWKLVISPKSQLPAGSWEKIRTEWPWCPWLLITNKPISCSLIEVSICYLKAWRRPLGHKCISARQESCWFTHRLYACMIIETHSAQHFIPR
jgi:hypothetical protein